MTSHRDIQMTALSETGCPVLFGDPLATTKRSTIFCDPISLWSWMRLCGGGTEGCGGIPRTGDPLGVNFRDFSGISFEKVKFLQVS